MYIQKGEKFIELIARNTQETKKDTWLWFSRMGAMASQTTSLTIV